MGDSSERDAPRISRPWMKREPGRLIGRGHPAGDFLEAYLWSVLEEGHGVLRLRAHVPKAVLNPRGQLFGGFTPTYVDLVALLTVRTAKKRDEAGFRTWLATTSMRLDYFEPIVGPEFVIDSRLVKKRGRTNVVETRFFDPEDTLAVLALTAMRELRLDRTLGDE